MQPSHIQLADWLIPIILWIVCGALALVLLALLFGPVVSVT